VVADDGDALTRASADDPSLTGAKHPEPGGYLRPLLRVKTAGTGLFGLRRVSGPPPPPILVSPCLSS